MTLEKFANWLAGQSPPAESKEVEAALSDSASKLSGSLAKLDVIVQRWTDPVADAPKTLPLPWYQRPTVLQYALAASVLLAVSALLWRELAPPEGSRPRGETAWGWLKPGALPTEGSASACYEGLANTLAEWNDVRPGTRAGMARRVAELRHACTILQFAELRPLPPAARKELRDWCRDWSKSFSDDLIELESEDTPNPRAVFERADRRVQQMIEHLRKQAKQSAAA